MRHILNNWDMGKWTTCRWGAGDLIHLHYEGAITACGESVYDSYGSKCIITEYLYRVTCQTCTYYVRKRARHELLGKMKDTMNGYYYPYLA